MDEGPDIFVPPGLFSVLGLRAAIPVPLGFAVIPGLAVEGVIRVTFGPWGRFCPGALLGELAEALLLKPGLVVPFPGFPAPGPSALNPGPPPGTGRDPTTGREGTR